MYLTKNLDAVDTCSGSVSWLLAVSLVGSQHSQACVVVIQYNSIVDMCSFMSSLDKSYLVSFFQDVMQVDFELVTKADYFASPHMLKGSKLLNQTQYMKVQHLYSLQALESFHLVGFISVSLPTIG